MPRVKMVASKPPDCRLNPNSSRMLVNNGAKTCRSAALIMKVSASSPNDTATTSLGTGPSMGRSFTRDGDGLAGTASTGIASIGSGYVGTTRCSSTVAPAGTRLPPVGVGLELDIIVSWSERGCSVRGKVVTTGTGYALRSESARPDLVGSCGYLRTHL